MRLTREIDGDDVAAFVVGGVGKLEVADLEDVPRALLKEAVLLLVDGKIEGFIAQRKKLLKHAVSQLDPD